MLGTIVNVAAIVVCSLLGLLLKNGLKEKYKQIVTQAVGLSVVFVGASGTISNILQPGSNPVLFIISMALGSLLGEAVGIEKHLENFGNWLQAKVVRSKDGDSRIAEGFVGASLIFCVGTMAILGPLNSGLKGDHSILFAKSVLDGIISLIMASTLGIGVIFSAVSVFAYQGALTLLAVWVSPYVTAPLICELSIVGGILITVIGLNQLQITHIKVGNMLPAMLGPILFFAAGAMFGW